MVIVQDQHADGRGEGGTSIIPQAGRMIDFVRAGIPFEHLQFPEQGGIVVDLDVAEREEGQEFEVKLTAMERRALTPTHRSRTV